MDLYIAFLIIWSRIFPWNKPGQWLKRSFSSLFRQNFRIHLPKALNHFFCGVIALMELVVLGSRICWASSLSISGEFHQTWLHLCHLTVTFNLADGFVLSSIVVKTIYMEFIAFPCVWLGVYILLPGSSSYLCSFRRQIEKSFYVMTFSYDRSGDCSLTDFCLACPLLCGKQTLWVSEVPLPQSQRVFTRKLSVCQSNFSLIFHVVQPGHFFICSKNTFSAKQKITSFLQLIK